MKTLKFQVRSGGRKLIPQKPQGDAEKVASPAKEGKTDADSKKRDSGKD